MPFAIIILAAGASSRMGRPKQLLGYNGNTLIRNAVDVAEQSKASPMIVVLGANYQLIAPEIEKDDELHIVVNEAWHEGMSSSIRAGVNALLNLHPAVDGAIFTVCDQPLLGSSIIDALIDKQAETASPIVACSYENTIGTPALFHKSLFPDLLDLSGDEGAKKIMLRLRQFVANIPFPTGNIDIDTDEQYQALTKKL